MSRPNMTLDLRIWINLTPHTHHEPSRRCSLTLAPFLTKHSECSLNPNIKHLSTSPALDLPLWRNLLIPYFWSFSGRKLSTIFPWPPAKGGRKTDPKVLWLSQASPTPNSTSIRPDVLSRNNHNWLDAGHVAIEQSNNHRAGTMLDTTATREHSTKPYRASEVNNLSPRVVQKNPKSLIAWPT